MKKKLVYILHDIKIGGVEVALISAIPDLIKTFDLKIVVLGEIDVQLLRDLSTYQKSVFVSFNNPIYQYPFVLHRICSFILEFNPDIIISSLWRASIVGVLLKKIRPAIQFYSFIHNTTFFHTLDALFSKAAIRIADVVLVDSKAAIGFVKKITSSDKYVSEVSMLTTRPLEAYKIKTLQDSVIKFLFLGRIHTQKNLSATVEVIHKLRQQGINAVLDIYGRDAGDLVTVKDTVAKLGLADHVQFCGEVTSSKKAALYTKYHFYIQLSTVEGMAMSVAESMQNGLVCIVTPVGEIPNYSAHMKSAIWFDKHNPDLIISNIKSVIDSHNLYNNISLNAYLTFQNKELYAQSLIRNILSHS